MPQHGYDVYAKYANTEMRNHEKSFVLYAYFAGQHCPAAHLHHSQSSHQASGE